MHRLSRISLLLFILTSTVGCDQATKQMAVSNLSGEPGKSFLGGTFRLLYAENPGAFLGMFGGLSREHQFWIFTAGVGAMLLGVLVYLIASRRLSPLHSIGLALVAGGGVSNWIDRLVNDGRVVDFMILGVGPVRTGVFNVADVAIMAGLGLFLLNRPWREEAPAESGPPSAAA